MTLNYVTLNYDNLCKLLIDRKMTKTEMRQAAGISSATLAKMSRGEAVDSVVLDKICRAMNCDAANIVSDETANSTKGILKK